MVFPSSEASVGVGTAADNEVQLSDPFVSRHHGRFFRTASGWMYRDLGSTNGSAIDRAGQQIALDASRPEADLVPGDMIVLGRSVLLVELIAPDKESPSRTLVASRGLEDLAGSGERQLAELDGLAAAYQLERQLGLALGPEQMLDAILAAMLNAFPGATHAMLLLIDKKTGRPRRQVARVRGEEGRARDEIPVSMSVANRVLTEGKSLLFLDVASEFADSQSAAAAAISSSLCAPLWTGEETVGLVQVDSRQGKASPPGGRRASFTERDLDRLSLFANRAALAIVASELYDAEERNRLLRDLSAMITHDLKGPLTAIMGFLDILAQEPLTGDQAEYVEIALASSKWLTVLIAGILDVAKMEGGEVELHRRPLTLAGEIAEALQLIDYQIREKRITLETVAPPGLPEVCADGELFRRIVVNLVGNSVKFAPGDSTITVSAALGGDADRVVISVRDQGPGIPKEHQGRIFDKFVQVAKGRSAEKISVGLGLAFCKMAVEAHGGSIWVESEPGQGACFSFSLPVSGNAMTRSG
jgi:signal transduction histidine kinase